MQRNVISSVNTLFCIYPLLNYVLCSQLFKISVMLICLLCDRLPLKLIIHTTYLCDITKSICAVSILHLGIVCILL